MIKSSAKALTTRTRALNYAAKGWLVIPMHTVKGGLCSCYKGAKCDNPGKHPTTPNGVKDATTNRKTIKRWWKTHPNANIGIATGRMSNILVLDIDPRNGGDKTFNSLEAQLGTLPDTVRSKTGGGGQHLLFAYPDEGVHKDTAGKLLGGGVDVLSDGAIMIAPPSRHQTGLRYKWISGKSFKDIEPAVLPKKWLTKLTISSNHFPAKPTSEIVPEGERNTRLTSLAGTLQRSGASPNAISAALNAENATRCTPPLDNSEVEKIVRSVLRYPVPLEGDRSDEAENLANTVLGTHFNGGKYLTFGADGRFWHYSGKVWSQVPDKWIDGRILDSIKKSATRTSQRSASLIKQVRILLEAQLAVRGDPFAFTGEPPRVVNCRNGEIWIGDDGKIELRPHRYDSYMRHLIEVDYDPTAKCSRYQTAVLGIFAKARKPKDMRRHWNELLGYLIQPRRNIPLIVVMLGAGANGKTVLTRTMIKLLGLSQVHTQRVEELDKNRFAVGSLLGKLAFIDDDVRAGARLPDGTLKMISEAKEVTGENKYRPHFNFVVRTVPILLCNNVPSLSDVSNGMLRRLMVIPFDRTFTAKDKDDGLFEKIWESELSGILNKALDGYSRLIKRGSFRVPSGITKCTEEWLKQANPVPAFIDECCVSAPDAKCRMKELYPAYKKWATDAGFTMIQNQMTLGRNLEHRGYKKIRGTGGYQLIVGLTLKS